MANVAALTMQLDDLKDKRSRAETDYEKAKKSRTWGLVGILIGLPLLAFYGFGVLFIIAGILAAITQHSKASKAKNDLDYYDNEISQLRQKIAEAADDAG